MAKTFVGTPNYMSPERLMGQQYNYISDVWSVGVTAYELATGSHPFPPSGVFLQTLQSICHSPEPNLNPQVFSPELCDFIKCCLDKTPGNRYTSEK